MLLCILFTVLRLQVCSSNDIAPFPINICGGSSVPEPTPLPGIDCPTRTFVDPSLGVRSINFLTGTGSVFPVKVYKCQLIRTFAYCYKYFWGIPEKHSWAAPLQIHAEDCNRLVVGLKAHAVSHSVVTLPYDCRWLQENTVTYDNYLIESTTAYYDIRTDLVTLPGAENSWKINQSLIQSNLIYIWVPDSSITAILSFKSAHTRTTACAIYTEYLICPYAVAKIWFDDLRELIVGNRTYLEADHGFMIVKDALWQEIETLRKRRTKRSASLETNYLLGQINSLRREQAFSVDNLNCEVRRLRRVTALAVSYISPHLAAEIEFGSRIPGLSLTPFGLVKYSCHRVDNWALRSEPQHTVEVPIVYTLYPGVTVKRGWLDPATLNVVSKPTQGPVTRYVRVNASHTYDIRHKRWILPLPSHVTEALAELPERGLVSYLHDELLLRATVVDVIVQLTGKMPEDQIRQKTDGLTVYAYQRNEVANKLAAAGTWLTSVLPAKLAQLYQASTSLLFWLMLAAIIYLLSPLIKTFRFRPKRIRRSQLEPRSQGAGDQELRPLEPRPTV